MTPPSLHELTTDEALLLAMAFAPDGERLAIHREGCPVSAGGECCCVPEVVTIRRGEG